MPEGLGGADCAGPSRLLAESCWTCIPATSGCTCWFTGSTDRRDGSNGLHGAFRTHWGRMWSVFRGQVGRKSLRAQGEGTGWGTVEGE